MECLDDSAIQAWVGGSVPEARAELVRTHLDSCDKCVELIASVVQSRWVGQHVARYKIVELIGGGAMGEVYRATDPDLGRDVAIKLVRPGGSQRRLLREAKAMAQLAHPNVIRVYDVGSAGDDVFIAMELVRGQSLRAWLEADANRPWRTIVSTLRAAGAGLVAAHEANFVHGDIKPDNILVADDGRVLVTDFGLVRWRANAGLDSIDREQPSPVISMVHSGTAVFAGTPAYMAPEQLDEPIATAESDQFSFCVTLYEALYGQRPFKGDKLSVLRASLSADRVEFPRPPSLPARLTRALRRGLSVVPSGRFPSLRHLLTELEAGLNHRRRIVAIGIALGIAAAAAATAAVAMRASAGPEPCKDAAAQFGDAWSPSRRAELERAFTASKLTFADATFATTSGLLYDYRDAWIATYTDTCKATRVRGDQSQALLDTRMACLQRRRDDADALTTRLASPDLDVPTAVAAVTGLRPVSDCEDVESLQDLAPPPTSPLAREQLSALDTELARCRAMLLTGPYPEAFTCAKGAAGTAATLDYAPAIADAELLVGSAAILLRDWPAAQSALTHALLAAETGRDTRSRVRALTSLITVDAERVKFADAHGHDDHANAILKGLPAAHRLASDLASTRGNLLLREGKFAEAEDSLNEAVRHTETLDGKDAPTTAESLGRLGFIQLNRKQYDVARTTLERVLAIQHAKLGPTHPFVGKTLHVLGQLESRAGSFDKAMDLQRRSYDILVAAYGEQHRDVAMSVVLAAQAHLLAGKYDEAVPLAQRAVDLALAAVGPEHPDYGIALQTLASTQTRAGKTTDALATHERIVALLLKTLGPDHLQTAQAQLNLAMSLRTAERCTDALPLLEASLAARTKLYVSKPDHPDIAAVLHVQGDCLVDLERSGDAIQQLERVLRIREATPPKTVDDKVALATARYSLARALYDAPASTIGTANNPAAARARATSLARAAHDELVALKDNRADNVAAWAKIHRIKL